MKLVNVEGRAAVFDGTGYTDLQRGSEGRFGPDPMDALEEVEAIRSTQLAVAPVEVDGGLLPPVPRPSKILGAGINYYGHLREAGFDPPDQPVFFAKLPSALTGPTGEIELPNGRTQVDWEAELVLVMGGRARCVSEADALSYVAGVTVGQDISDREEQFRSLRQFTMGKSFDTYAPVGPALVTLDEIDDLNDLRIRTWLDGELVQDGATSDWIFPAERLISWASHVCTLEPGDLIFTGTPSGVGYIRTPARFLRPGMLLETEIEGVGKMANKCVVRPGGHGRSIEAPV